MATSEYARWLLAENKDWELYLQAADQCYLGRAYAWWKREGEMQRFTHVSPEEFGSLALMLRLYDSVLEEFSEPNHMNHLWLGNEFAKHKGHGHMHIIPRYRGKRTFCGGVFVDKNWGANYTPHEKMVLPEPTLLRLRDVLRDEIKMELLWNPLLYPSLKVAE